MNRKLADVVIGTTSALLVFFAVPGVLALLVGDPLPTHWTRAALISLHGLFELLAIVAWCSWAICAWSLLRTVVLRVRTRDTTMPSRLVDRLAVRMAVAILAFVPAGIAGAGAGAGASGAVTVRRPPAATAPPAGHASQQRSGAETATEVARSVHTVRAGESLWHIAQRWYGDGATWPAVARSNLDRAMVDGARFVDPSHLREGWHLVMPTLDATWTGHPDEASRHDGVTPSAHRTLPRPRRSPTAPNRGESWPDPLPELTAIGAGSLVAALLARRARQARRLRSLSREEGSPSLPRPPDAVELSGLLAPFDRSPLLHWVEAGLAHLTLAARRETQPLPGVQWLRAGCDGVDVHFAADPPSPPAPWVASGAASWRLPASLDPENDLAVQEVGPWCPVIVPVGDDENTTWLLPISPGTCLTVVGPLAGQLLHSMEAAASRWAWHEALVVTSDARAAMEAVGDPRSPGTARNDTSHVLFVGDPRALPEDVRARCSVLTAESSIDAAASVVVDRRGATVHPYGVALRPHLLDAAWTNALAELSTAPAPPVQTGTAVLPKPSPLHRDKGPSAIARVARAQIALNPVTPTHEHLPFTRGPAEVRLLVSIPMIEGLSSQLPSKRARRATELIAYLALHCPEPVTGDRLRTRVLGTPETDAAAKTLFNTAHAARCALGVTPEGEPLFPSGTRTGHYQISPLVTVDVRRAEAWIEAGLSTPAGEEHLELLERGLSLVDGEPLGGVLSGYGWWQAEGHERHLADLVVDGACALARGATAAGTIDRARWALGRARRVESYSEALTRAAMEVAAASGDAPRLHAEWLDCQRQVDELDPGGTPSAATERLYARLRAALGVGERAQGAFAARL